ncbi:Os12g0216500, partial [Oryza sativa Japonica Group]
APRPSPPCFSPLPIAHHRQPQSPNPTPLSALRIPIPSRGAISAQTPVAASAPIPISRVASRAGEERGAVVAHIVAFAPIS